MRFARVGALIVFFASGPAWAGRHALLVGVNDYPHARPLKGAVNDVTAIRQLIVRDLQFPEANVTMLVNGQATKAAILRELAALEKRTQPGDAVLIYYSGHGWLVRDEDGDEPLVDGGPGYDEALVPYDAVPWPKERAREPNSTLLIDDEIARALGPLRGRRVAVVFDSCHAGGGLRALPGDDPGRSLYPDVPLAPTRFKSLTPRPPSLNLGGQAIFIAAAEWRQTASDLGEFNGERHGALTAGLLRTIQKAGPGWERSLTWESLFRQTRQDMLSQGIASQTPTISASPVLARLPLQQFLDPPPATEIAEMTSNGAFEVYLEVNKFQFLEGELLELGIESERDGYLYVFDINPEKEVTQLFPNQFEKDNKLPAARLARVPGVQSKYQLRAGKPLGISTVVALVTRKPWDEHARLSLPQSLQPLSGKQEDGLRSGLRQLQSGREEVEWGAQRVSVEVVARRTEVEAQPVTAPPERKPLVAAAAASTRALSEDDSDITWEEQQNLQKLRPALYKKLEQLAERFSPTFWQDISGSSPTNFRPWKDFFVRYDFDQTESGPNWPAPPRFQDEVKRERIRSLDALLLASEYRRIEEVRETPGVFRVTDRNTGEKSVLDLRPYVYWTVLTTPTHYFFHFAAFKAEDWKPMFGHPGDLEGCTIIVDRKTEKMVAALTLAHDDVQVTRGLNDEAESNIEVLVDPALASRDAAADDLGRPINGALRMDAARAGDPAPREHQDIYSETRGHGQYGPGKIHPTRYIVYANFLPADAWRAPSFAANDYLVTDKFAEVKTKYKYKLIYFGAGSEAGSEKTEKTMWGEYRSLSRFPGGVNPPWCWRDNLWFRTGWWKDPRTVLKIGEAKYRINPYLAPGGSK